MRCMASTLKSCPKGASLVNCLSGLANRDLELKPVGSRNSTGLKRRGLQARLGVVALVRKLLNKHCH